MMFRSAAVRQMRRATVQTVRRQPLSSKPLLPANVVSQWYSVFGKSNAAYASWLVIGILVAEAFTGAATNALWNSVNYGKTYETVDWTKFKTDDDEEEEEEEEEEDDDDE